MRTAIAATALFLTCACASTHPIQPQVASASVDFAGAETVEVTLSNFAFAPSPLRLAAGRPYLLKLSNRASGGHDFAAPEFFAASRIHTQDAASVAEGEIDLAGGESASIRLVPTAGEYKLVCTHFGHSALGMTGKIIVQ